MHKEQAALGPNLCTHLPGYSIGEILQASEEFLTPQVSDIKIDNWHKDHA